MTVLGGWAAVLSRLSGQEDVVIGTPTANRGRREIEPLIGFFVNMLALRVDLSGSPGVAQLLGRGGGVWRGGGGARTPRALPFEQVVEIVRPPRRLEHAPVFQVMLAWQNNEAGELALPGLEIEPAALTYTRVRFDLDLSLAEAGGQIVGTLRYASALFDAGTIERQVGYLRA